MKITINLVCIPSQYSSCSGAFLLAEIDQGELIFRSEFIVICFHSLIDLLDYSENKISFAIITINFPRTRVVDVCHKCSSYTWRAQTYIYAARWTLASLAFNIMMYSEQRFNKCGVKCQASAGAYVTATFAVTLIEWVCFCQKLWLFPQMQTVIIVASGALSKTLLIFKWIQNNNGDEKRHIIIAMARETGRTTAWLMPDEWRNGRHGVVVGGWSGYCLLSVSIDFIYQREK